MSQQALATAVGVHVNTVARWERNGIDPRHKLLPSIAAVLNGDGREKGISYAVLIAG
jgi:transcriptional regulator with XRE-family HTH domain